MNISHTSSESETNYFSSDSESSRDSLHVTGENCERDLEQVYWDSDDDSVFDSTGSSSDNVICRGRKRKISSVYESERSDVQDESGTSDEESVEIATPTSQNQDLHVTINHELYVDTNRQYSPEPPSSVCSSIYSSSSSSESESDEWEESDNDDTDCSVAMEGEASSIYSGSTISTENFDALLLAFSQKHHLPQAAIDDLLKFFKLTLPDDNNVPASSHMFNKRNATKCALSYNHIQVCPKCHQNVDRERLCQNNNCQSHGDKVKPVGFFVLPIKPQVQRLVKEHWKAISSYQKEMAVPQTGYIRDIIDGIVYQSSLKTPRTRNRSVFSLVVSSDGAPMLKSRKYNIWPLMCFLVELPPNERYKFTNIMLTGLWYGKEKPIVELYLKSFVDELKVLNAGCEFENDTGQKIPSMCRIQSVVPDLPAKAMLFNVKQYNGLFGCTTCKHPGTYSNNFRSRLYEYTASKNVSLRTAKESERYAKLADISGTTIFGFKGKNVFGKLVMIPDNLPIDWMHCVCEGILKRQLFNKWFDDDHGNEDYSLLEVVEPLDQVFLSVKVPHDFTRKPRSVNDRKHWKASEFRMFVLFAGLPCLRHAVLLDAFPLNHFFHFSLLVTALRYLHAVPVLSECVQLSQVLLDNFVRLMPILYGQKESTYNNHALLHFPSQVLDNGSLSYTSAFVFESFISHLKNLFTETRGIPKQMVEKLGVSQNYRNHVHETCMENPEAQRLVCSMLKENHNYRVTEDGIILHEPLKYMDFSNPSAEEALITAFGNQHDSQFHVSTRMTKEKITFHSTMYSRKGQSCSYIVQYQLRPERERYGEVVCYLLEGELPYALIKKYRQTGTNVCQGLGEDVDDPALLQIVQKQLVGQHFLEIESKETYVVIRCSMIKNRCLYVPSNNTKAFITVLDTPYEHD